MVWTYFQTYFACFHLLQACWQPSCSTVDYYFNAARLEPELLSRDGVISTIVPLMTSLHKAILRLHNSCAVHFIKQFMYCTGRKIINKPDKLQQKDFDSATTTHGQYFTTLNKSSNLLSIGNLPNSQIYDYPLILLQPSSKFPRKAIEQLRKKGGRNETLSVSIIYWGYT